MLSVRHSLTALERGKAAHDLRVAILKVLEFVLLQCLVFFSCLDQHRQILIGVFPGGEEILVLLACFAGVSSEQSGACQANVGERVNRRGGINAAVLNDRLKVCGGCRPISLLQISLTPNP